MRYLLVLLVACATPKAPTPWRHVPAFHIDEAADVRWPVERTLFVGTARGAMLQLDDNPSGPVARPRLIALDGAWPDGRIAVSGIGRAVTGEQAAAGAVIALDDVQHERDIAAPHLTAYPMIRIDADLSVALAQTYVTAEGIVRERDGRFVLELATHDELPLLVAACDGEADARAQVGKARQVYGTLAGDPALAISLPTFE